LSILNTLTILEKDGVRRFTELVRYIYLPTEPVYDSEQETKVEIEEKPAGDMMSILLPRIQEALDHLQKLEADSAATNPESSFDLENDFYTSKTPEEAMEYLLDGFTLPPKVDNTELVDRIMAAFVHGIKLKDAQPEFFVDDEPENTPDPDSGKKAGTEEVPDKQNNKKSKKKKNKKQNSYESPEAIRKKKEQWEQKRLKRRLDKKMGKSKRNKKKRK
nr:hypothetical protein [Enterococcus sp. 665A]